LVRSLEQVRRSPFRPKLPEMGSSSNLSGTAFAAIGRYDAPSMCLVPPRRKAWLPGHARTVGKPGADPWHLRGTQGTVSRMHPVAIVSRCRVARCWPPPSVRSASAGRRRTASWSKSSASIASVALSLEGEEARPRGPIQAPRDELRGLAAKAPLWSQQADQEICPVTNRTVVTRRASVLAANCRPFPGRNTERRETREISGSEKDRLEVCPVRRDRPNLLEPESITSEFPAKLEDIFHVDQNLSGAINQQRCSGAFD
jgi:hypothetical protein